MSTPRRSTITLTHDGGAPFTLLIRNGATALCVAAEEDHVDIVQLLLQNGANVSERKE